MPPLSMPVHPRARGEHMGLRPYGDWYRGSSPRTRGTLFRVSPAYADFRFIPAHAGNIGLGRPVGSVWAVHPRARGEHRRRAASRHDESGSSPRTRGTYDRRGLRLESTRFIPAHAGNMPFENRSPRGRTVHPRARGEHARVAAAANTLRGSSPRTRGTSRVVGGVFVARRFIPAHAGNIRARSLTGSRLTVHPRARGEHSWLVLLDWRMLGSSPRTRGTCAGRVTIIAAHRFIPAHAGNISREFRGPASPAVHPRARGEHSSDSL